jgi:hypothetical protein
MLSKIKLSIESGRDLHKLLGVSPFVVLLSNNPPEQAVGIIGTDWDIWGKAVKSVPLIVRERCKQFAKLEMISHSGNLLTFWANVHNSFDQPIARSTFAPSFIKRFTSTLSTDESRMAKALFNECYTDMNKVRAVFLELDRNYSSDSDDVAEYYVNLVKAHGGPVRNALQADRTLISLLIRLLDEGVTFPGEKKCINYLKSL